MSGTVGVLLAAGAGRRAGGPKALRRTDHGQPVLRRTAEALLDGGCTHVVVVVGAQGDEVRALLTDRSWSRRRYATVVDCPDWASGMSASLRSGLETAASGEGVGAVVVHLVDLPDVGSLVVRRLLTSGGSRRTTLARATYDGRPGHPVLVGTDHVGPLLTTLEGDRGARDYLDANGALEVECGDLATGLDDDVSPVATSRAWWAREPTEPGPGAGFEELDDYVQLACRPMFELWGGGPPTPWLRAHASDEQIALFAAYVTSADVDNGGWTQWLVNGCSDLFADVVDGFRMIGLGEAADLAERVVGLVLPDGLPLDRDTRNEALSRVFDARGIEAVMAEIAECEESYYVLTDARSTSQLLLHMMATYVAGHPDRFFVPTVGATHG